MSKIIYATIKLTVKNKTTEEDITEADYEFEHPNIIATEWIETKESDNDK
tara:strand:+ start:205 stop:354 length:150 start_codon:yes stop_codon:yes gene_type:complete